MKRNFFAKLSLTLLFYTLVYSNLSAQQQNDFFTMVPGILGDQLIVLDTTMVLVSADWGYTPDSLFIFRNTIRLHFFNAQGNFLFTNSFNLSDAGWYFPEVLRSLSRKKIHRLSNGNILMGGHARVVDPEVKINGQYFAPSDTNYKEALSYGSSDEVPKDQPPMANPLILTFNSTLDSLLRVDTLEAVPYFGNITLIHEVAPDTLLISYHKTYPSNQVLLETDSLFNVRWISEDFGKQDYWEADIYDFLVTPEGDYIISMEYFYQYTANPLGYNKNILFKFDRLTGELLWEKQVWTGKGQNTFAVMAPWKDDKFVIALDDCCKITNPFWNITFHEHTGMHLQVRDSDGAIHQEISLRDFLWTFVKVFPGPDVYGDDLEDPDNIAPWFIPLNITSTADGSFLITGVQYSCSHRYFGRGFLLKLDHDLLPQWARIFEIDKKNYVYGTNYAFLYNAVEAFDRIYMGGSFVTVGYSGINSPNYPPNYPWDFHFRKDLFFALDNYGCYEPGCHLSDNIPHFELAKSIHLYPNPAVNQCRLHISNPELAQKDKVLFISDLHGRGVLTQRFSGDEWLIDTSGYPSGIYLVYIMMDGNVLKAEKLMISR